MARPLRILYVDDDEDLRICIAETLRQGGYDVDIASSARQGLALLRQNRYAVVISDQHMPGGTGRAMLRQARSEDLLDETATCLLTSDPDPGLEPVLTKPIRGDALLAAVAELAATRTRPRPRRRRARWVASAAAVVALTVASWVALQPSRRAPAAVPAGHAALLG